MQALIVTTLRRPGHAGRHARASGCQAGTLPDQRDPRRPADRCDDHVTAVVLLLLGALSKSALFPFHFWLPGAMAAPTPVSAYLHAAAMVKAGVYLVALLAPAFAGVPGWRGLLLSSGWSRCCSAAGGRCGSSTSSCCSPTARSASSASSWSSSASAPGLPRWPALAMLVAHALFKAALFLVVGIVDHQTGTRDLRELSGVGRSRRCWPARGPARRRRRWPACRRCPASSPRRALRRPDRRRPRRRRDRPRPARRLAVLVGVVLGSALTVAYTARFLWGTFATKPGVAPLGGRTGPPAGSWPRPPCSPLLSLVLGFLGGAADRRCSRRTPTSSRPAGTSRPGAVARPRARRWPARWCRWRSGCCSFWARESCRRAAVARPRCRSERRARLPSADARARPGRGRGDRPDPARLGGDLPRA